LSRKVQKLRSQYATRNLMSTKKIVVFISPKSLRCLGPSMTWWKGEFMDSSFVLFR
jgi:hypothetical protein